MYSAISGMLAQQFRMDVIGNNLSNVNTLGFKSSDASFVQTFSQISAFATQTTPVGVNVGLGASVSGTTTAFTQGAFQRTDVPTDVALQGDGFFEVATRINSATNVPDAVNGQVYFTRAGNFIIDDQGYLRTTDGNYVLGYEASTVAVGPPTDLDFATTNSTTAAATNTVSAIDPATVQSNAAAFTSGNLKAIRMPQFIDPDTPVNINGNEEGVANFSIAGDGKITLVGQGGALSTPGYVAVARFDNNNGLSPRQNSYYQQSAASGNPIYAPAGTGSTGTIQSGVLELSNVDVATEFANMIVTQRGFDANAHTITTVDEMLQTVVNLIR
jgi:flagellar hook protein FlgE